MNSPLEESRHMEAYVWYSDFLKDCHRTGGLPRLTWSSEGTQQLWVPGGTDNNNNNNKQKSCCNTTDNLQKDRQTPEGSGELLEKTPGKL